MATNVEALKNLYVTLGGNAADVADLDSNVKALKALYVALGGDIQDVASLDSNSEMISALSNVATGGGGGSTASFVVNDGVVEGYELHLVIPEGVTSIGDAAFGDCTSLTSVTIPESVTSIGDNAFGGCTGLTSVTIPESVTSIGGSAFANCTGLTSVTVRATDVPSLGVGAFRNTHDNLIIYVPAESLDAYKAAEVWDTYESQIQAIAE